jgi:hypothetical protein
MGTLSTIPGFSDPNTNESKLQQDIDQARLQQMQVQTQLQAQMLKQSKGPSTFRKVLGAITGVAANIVAPGLGGAIGNMIMGGNKPPVASFSGLNAAGLPGSTAGLDEITNAMAQNNAATEKLVAEGIKYNQNEMSELANIPKGPDPVAVLALTEKTNEQSEIFQATSAVAKAKHEAAMAAIQNIKD